MRVRLALVLSSLLTAGLLLFGKFAGAGPQRDAADTVQVAGIRARSPHAAELLEAGERLGAHGALEAAVTAFDQARAEDPLGAGFYLRRKCEALTSLNRREEAQAACWAGMQEQRAPAVIAATVRALVAGPTPPSFDEVSQALTLLTLERKKAIVQNPRIIEAMCEVAESIGDGVMLQHCEEQLEKLAPGSPAQKRALAALEAPCPPWLFWIGWLTVGLACFVTAADALRRLVARRPRGNSARAAVTAALVLAVGTFARVTYADLPPAPPGAMMSIWAVDDKDPEGHIPSEADRNANPLQMGYWLQDLIFKAELAVKHDDHQAAIKYYRAMHKAVPNRALPVLRLCDEYEKTNDLHAAINACGSALLLEGLTINDYAHFVRLVLRQPGNLSLKDVQAMMNVIGNVKQQYAGSNAPYELECEVAMRINDLEKLKECTAGLATTAPNDPQALYYEWTLAMQQNDFRRARDLLAQAKISGVKDETLHNMELSLAKNSKRHRLWIGVATGGALLVLLALGFGIATHSRRREEPATA
jgi:hypothetical protein